MNNDKVTSFKEYQLLKQLSDGELDPMEYILDVSTIEYLDNNGISDIEKRQINNNDKNVSSLSGWVLSDHVVMRNAIKLVFKDKGSTQEKEILIQTNEFDQLVSLLNE